MWPAITFIALVGVVLADYWWRNRQHQRRLAADRQQYTTTALRQQQHTAANTQAQQQALFDSMVEGVLLLDNERRVQMANPSLREMLRLQDERLGQPLLEWVRWPELAKLIDRVAAEQRVADVDLDFPAAADQRSFHINGTVITDNDGAAQGIMLVFHDITRIKRLENTRQEFVANVSHELRTPLSIIKGSAEMLLDAADGDAAQRARLLGMIDKHADRLTFLIDDLLTISQLESGRSILNRQPVVLRDAAQHVAEDLSARAHERGVTLANEVPAELRALADADRLQQVFSNLIENAIKYGRHGGRVTLGGRTLAGTVELWVRDDGPGIPPDAANRVFERFFRADKARSREAGGTGLGLAIVKHIVQAHGGQVRVESAPGQGATFFFTLPTS